MPKVIVPCAACIQGDHTHHKDPGNWWHRLWSFIECPCRGECADSQFVWWLREQEFANGDHHDTDA